ncbi:fimbrial protein [Leminorella richardii]|uniref:fimbrial protein n=1 Tax=Leminorella richardii TaxID=158841 RepID=UPI0014745690|nr:fimbrial protein [Leminorella richardii]
MNFSGVINVVSRSCQVDDVDVDLGSHQLTSFTGIGTVTNWKDFNITLRNCPPFHGYYATRDSLVYSETSGVVTNNAPTSNRIDMAFRGANGYRSSNMAYLNAGSDQAKGIGLQMTDASENLILFNGTTYDPALALTKVDGASYVIPLKARYYQYSSTVTAGKANASVTFTINYY